MEVIYLVSFRAQVVLIPSVHLLPWLLSFDTQLLDPSFSFSGARMPHLMACLFSPFQRFLVVLFCRAFLQSSTMDLLQRTFLADPILVPISEGSDFLCSWRELSFERVSNFGRQ
ncbi:hypothetical protein Dsin_013674 [Dipteronia sinensis]|uniref:Uncharacterized protein n=1 Tax=Dipteronia sinensis TaxID=43782 RepID=A0AAE0ALM4_9ROSI|nr:hypothetical protein Dsin_013674 [Dipteronia sinensis]